MRVKLFAVAVALVLAASAPVMAACATTFELGALDAPSLIQLGNVDRLL
jgi:hypothetical protein